ncbi:peptidase C14 caspase catalytic subunit p20 [[Leptolyngbya] sp. PCC 7376]|uniref:caspase family protein n=1 Tax=[Leptolyngbya] sp. PCC 7376 TaxID=111781 RepID=UPI00029EFB3C|nr:caspase family protein [[Leptolyngbya] sp. PCC 7376]AFY36470.1 peptidase C14 caspase catalytic subunit p20 [[Leptolyngbya] sp. PCC 7376]
MKLDRRSFLQGLGLALFSFGVLDQGLRGQIDRYAQALEKFSGRKFALLIGIDRYPEVDDLNGCGVDIEIQKQLLMHRFGFDPAQIIVLKNEAANRDNIFTTFQKQLKDILTPEDFLFVHFSGYGTSINTAQGDSINALMPVDGVIGKTNKVVVNNAIAVSTIEGFIQSLNVAQSALILDTSFSPLPEGEYQYLRGRAYPKSISSIANPSETAIEEQLQRNIIQRNLGGKSIIKLSAAELNGGKEFAINGAHVGLFTATLAQNLFAVNPKATISEANSFLNFRYQQLQLLPEGQPAPQFVKKSIPLYGLLPTSITLPSVGHVVAVDGSSVELNLIGYAPEVLQAIASESEVKTIETTPKILSITSKNGLSAQAKTSAKDLVPNTPLQEYLRVLPRNLTLRVALGDELSRIERVDATSAFAGIVGIANISNPAEWADYIFDEGYRLFSLSGEPLPELLPQDSNQAIKSSVEELEPTLERLLALKWLRLLVNETTTSLQTQSSLNRLEPRRSPLIQKTTPINISKAPTFQAAEVKLNETLAFQYKNLGQQALNLVGFALSPKQEMLLLTPQSPLQVEPGKTQTAEIDFAQQRPVGRWQVYWVGSIDPLTKFQEQLDRQFANVEAATVKVEEPLPFIRAILEDLSAVTDQNMSDSSKETYRLATDRWLTNCFIYDVAENLPKVN